ncbi:MAG: asparagine synthetase B family protein, partial [Candidatus Acidiferrales bacterium]
METLLRDAVALRMEADVPLGAFLSGGIDSSLVTALMQSQSVQPVRTFSIGFDDPALDEAAHARAVADHLGTAHTEFSVGADNALALVPQLAATFDEPFADHSQIPTLLLSELARRQVTVALSGDGGDELFAGYGRYFAILKLWRLLGLLPATLRRGVAPTLAASAAILRPLSAFGSAGSRLPQRLGRLAERLTAPDVDELRLSFIGGAGVQRLQDEVKSRDFRHCLPPQELHDTLRRLMYGDQLDYLPDDILHKLDRASMAHSLEARVPLLDHRVVEFSWRLPRSMLVDGNRGKMLLRRVLERHVPRALVDRPKQGFTPPLDSWLRGPLRDWAEPLLAPEALRELPMLDAVGVRRLWEAHLQQRMEAGHA